MNEEVSINFSEDFHKAIERKIREELDREFLAIKERVVCQAILSISQEMQVSQMGEKIIFEIKRAG